MVLKLLIVELLLFETIFRKIDMSLFKNIVIYNSCNGSLYSKITQKHKKKSFCVNAFFVSRRPDRNIANIALTSKTFNLVLHVIYYNYGNIFYNDGVNELL